MKPASVIVLIIAAILVVSGIIMCLVGNSVAKKDNMELFPKVRDGVPYLKQEFSANKISKIELDVNNVTVNVTGGDITSSIEFINYNPNLYTLDVTSQAISFDEIESIKSLFNIWENGFGFKGYRNLLNLNSLRAKGSKEINVHLGDGSLISSLVIKGKNVKINVENAQIKKEFKLIAENAEVNLLSFTAGAGISFECENLSALFDTTACGKLKIESDNTKLIARKSDLRQIDVTTDSGSVDIGNLVREEKTEYDFSTKSGVLTVDGEKVEGFSYSVKPTEGDPEFTYRIKTASANISYSNEEPENTDQTSQPEETAA